MLASNLDFDVMMKDDDERASLSSKYVGKQVGRRIKFECGLAFYANQLGGELLQNFR